MEIDVKKAKCTSLELSAPVCLADGDSSGKFIIEAYTGAIVDRFWGKLGIEVSGIKAKQRIPVFKGHDQTEIVGWSDRTWSDNSFMVSGVFSESTSAAKEAKALAAEGFPWQASIGVRPTKVLSISEKNSQVVNGVDITGPAEVWTESEVFEVSFVPLGADDQTSISTFSKFIESESEPQGEVLNNKTADEGENMMPITIEKLQTEEPALLKEIQESARIEGATAERERIQAVLAQTLPGHESLTQKLAFDGATSAQEAAIKVLSAEKTLRINKSVDLQDDAVAPVVATNAPVETKKADPETEEEFKADKELFTEFNGDFDSYSAFLSATGKGLVKIMRNKEIK